MSEGGRGDGGVRQRTLRYHMAGLEGERRDHQPEEVSGYCLSMDLSPGLQKDPAMPMLSHHCPVN